MKPLVLKPLAAANPLVSVLIANYNYGRYIRDTLASVSNQTYQHFEICICDDGSKDDSRQVIEAAAQKDPRIKFVFQDNAGVAVALNKGWAMSTGEIITFLDADDVWLPTRLEKTVAKFLQNSQAGQVVHPVTQVEADMVTVIRDSYPAHPAIGWCGERLLRGEFIDLPPCSGLSLRRDVATIIFPLNPAFRTLADSVFRDHAAILSIVDVVPEPLALMRLHGANVTTTKDMPADLKSVQKIMSGFQKLWTERQSFVKKELGLDVSISTWTDEALPLMLGELLLSGKPAEPALLQKARSEREKNIWKLLFACPRWLGSIILTRFWWRESSFKKSLKNLLFGRKPVSSPAAL